MIRISIYGIYDKRNAGALIFTGTGRNHHSSRKQGKKKGKIWKYIQQIKEKGIRAGIAISPESEWEEIKPYLDEAEEILVMSTVPGREGSVFIESTYEKIRCIKHLITEQKRNTMLSVDGGLNLERALDCIRNGADRIIMGRAFLVVTRRKSL